MNTDSSQVNSVLTTEENEDDGDDVIVIHEHHHHHHHEDDQLHNDTMSSSSLLENILNDEVLYDFVSFLIEEAHSNNERDKPSIEEDENIWKRFSESYSDYPGMREQRDQLHIVSNHDTKQFLEDGFEPIVEVELEK